MQNKEKNMNEQCGTKVELGSINESQDSGASAYLQGYLTTLQSSPHTVPSPTSMPTETYRPLSQILQSDSVPLTKLQQFDESIKNITGDRGRVYAHPADNFARIAAMHAVVKECKDPLVRHALEMICVKISRLIETPTHLDSLVDIVGYARCAVMCIDRK